MTKTQAAIYARISRDIEGQALGVQRQIEACQQLADRLGVEVAEIYVDNDTSAYKTGIRKNYERMLSGIRDGLIQAVIVWNLDRLLRQTKELETYLELCQPLDIATYEVTAGMMDLTTPSGRATARTRGAWAQFESEHRADRIRAQKAQAARAGRHLGGPVPFGWQRVDHYIDDNGSARGGRIVPEPFTARLLAEGTRMILSGKSIGDVARYWADEGARSGSGRTFKSGQVRRFLLRPRNAGLVTFRGETVSDSWPAVVDLEDFRALEALLTAPERNQHSEHKRKYLLSGVVYCHCGRRAFGLWQSGKKQFIYRCPATQEPGKKLVQHISRDLEFVDAYVTEIAVKYLERSEVVEAIRERVNRRRATPVESQSVVELNNRKNTLTRMFAQGQISEAQLIEGSAEIDSQLKEISGRVKAHTGSPALATLAVAENPGQAFRDAELEVQREILRALMMVEIRPVTSRKHDRPIDQEIIIHWLADPGLNFPPEILPHTTEK
ncbi:MAG: recombinase family protein [Micrococcaceae bacterium]|nr:recombinase family protein [Micrococcaceae bacterium]